LTVFARGAQLGSVVAELERRELDVEVGKLFDRLETPHLRFDVGRGRVRGRPFARCRPGNGTSVRPFGDNPHALQRISGRCEQK
jgi:hypothetical protein